MKILRKILNRKRILPLILTLLFLTGCAAESSINESGSSVQQSGNETGTTETSTANTSTSAHDTEEDEQSSNILVVYYSQSGNTRAIAERIVDETGADLYEIKIDRTYSDDMWDAWDEVQAELESGDLPNITEELPDLTPYDTILIGGPVWGRTISNPILVYMNQTDFTGKTVSAFWTFYSHDENYDSTMRELAASGNYVEGLSLPRSVTGDEASLNEAIETWLASFQ